MIHDPSELTKKQSDTVLREIQNILWPGGNRDHEWEADDIEKIAQVLIDGGIGPDYTR